MEKRSNNKQKKKRQRQYFDPLTTEIAIIGCGLTALSTSILLEQNGYKHITIYERDISINARKDGYGLTLTYNPVGILQQLNVLNDITNVDCSSRSHYLFTSNGTILGYYGNALLMNNNNNTDIHSRACGYGQRGNLRIPRQNVRKILLSKLYITEILWNYKLVNIIQKQKQSNNNNENQDDNNNNEKVIMYFDNGKVIKADLVIAADGIYSTVVQTIFPTIAKPKSLGIRIILGLTDHDLLMKTQKPYYHELLHERGFYTLHNGIRLFVMPYSGSALGRSYNVNEPVRYMWQLSFVSNDNNNKSSKELQIEALQRTNGWHDPVQTLIQCTVCTDIWGTLLHDRNPDELYKQWKDYKSSNTTRRIIIAGDALHAMSPFKGQGANKCLQDGAIIAKWLSTNNNKKCSSIDASINGCMREMVQRTSSVVKASRVAAQFWHSNNVALMSIFEGHKFAGIKLQSDVNILLNELKYRSISAYTKNLDYVVCTVAKELGLLLSSQDLDNSNNNNNLEQQPTSMTNNTSVTTLSENDKLLFDEIIKATSNGDLPMLRKVSWMYPNMIRFVKHPLDGSTCLHVAAHHGQCRILHWLLTEAGCNIDKSIKDFNGNTVYDVVTNESCRELLNRL